MQTIGSWALIGLQCIGTFGFASARPPPELWEGPVAEYLSSLTDAAKKE
jgi:hypothetical protein